MSRTLAWGCLLAVAGTVDVERLLVREGLGDASRSQCVETGVLEVAGTTPVVLLTSAKIDSLDLARQDKRAARQMLFASAVSLFASSALLIYHENSWAAEAGDELITVERVPRFRSTLRPCLVYLRAEIKTALTPRLSVPQWTICIVASGWPTDWLVTAQVDLFVAEPSVLAMQRPEGAIESFYAAMGAWEPVEKRLRLQSGKLLARKVAAIKHAVHSVPNGTVIVWTDVDVVFLRPLDGEFTEFVAKHDVTYCPMQGRNLGTLGLDDPRWRVESGVMAFHVNARTRALTSAALELYDGGTLRVATACRDRAAAGQPEPECSETWLRDNVFLNDIYVWALLLHGAHRNSTLLRELVPSFSEFSEGLEQAWFTQLQCDAA